MIICFSFQKKVKSPANKKKVQESPGNIKKRRLVQDMLSLKNDLLKAITPWIGNVIMPLPVKENTLCEGTDPCLTSDKTPENM